MDRDDTVRLLGVGVVGTSEPGDGVGESAAREDAAYVTAVAETVYELLAVPAPRPVRQPDEPWPPLASVRRDVDPEVARFADAWNGDAAVRRDGSFTLAEFARQARGLGTHLADARALHLAQLAEQVQFDLPPESESESESESGAEPEPVVSADASEHVQAPDDGPLPAQPMTAQAIVGAAIAETAIDRIEKDRGRGDRRRGAGRSRGAESAEACAGASRDRALAAADPTAIR